MSANHALSPPGGSGLCLTATAADSGGSSIVPIIDEDNGNTYSVFLFEVGWSNVDATDDSTEPIVDLNDIRERLSVDQSDSLVPPVSPMFYVDASLNVRVHDGVLLDYENVSTRQFAFDMVVSDGVHWSQGTLSINVTDVASECRFTQGGSVVHCSDVECDGNSAHNLSVPLREDVLQMRSYPRVQEGRRSTHFVGFWRHGCYVSDCVRSGIMEPHLGHLLLDYETSGGLLRSALWCQPERSDAQRQHCGSR